jgi:hypothetical protein
MPLPAAVEFGMPSPKYRHCGNGHGVVVAGAFMQDVVRKQAVLADAVRTPAITLVRDVVANRSSAF